MNESALHLFASDLWKSPLLQETAFGLVRMGSFDCCTSYLPVSVVIYPTRNSGRQWKGGRT